MGGDTEERKARAWWDAMPVWMKAGLLVSLGSAGTLGGSKMLGVADSHVETPSEIIREISDLKASRAVFEEKFKGVERRLDSIESLQMEILKELRRGRLMGDVGGRSRIP